MKTSADQKKVRKKLVDEIKESSTKPVKKEPITINIPTNIDVLDMATSGGYPQGQTINVVGDKSTGKTFLACEFIASAKNLLGDKLKWFYDDVEERFSINTEKLFGFNIIRKKQKNSHTIEEFSKNLKNELEDFDGKGVFIYVLDSYDELSSDAEQKRDDKDKERGTYNLEKNKSLGEFFRLRAKQIRDKNCILIIISQVRENIGVMFGAKYYRTGGKALDHMATVIMWLAEVEKHKKKDLTYGISTKCKITKVGNDRPFRQCIIEILFDYGVDNISSNILYLYDLRTDKGQRKEKLNTLELEWDGEKFLFKQLIKHIEDNNLEKELSQRVRDKWNKLEESVSSKNRKAKWSNQQ